MSNVHDALHALSDGADTTPPDWSQLHARAAQRRRRTRVAAVAGGSALALAAGLLGALVLLPEARPSQPLSGVQSFSDLGRAHVEHLVHYDISPPVGGDHNVVPTACGTYDRPVPNGNVVHSLEHGVVWVTYNPAEASPDDRRALADFQRSRHGVVVSPYPGMQQRLSVQAWGKELDLDGPDDRRLVEFYNQYVGMGPERFPGANCYGTDATVDDPNTYLSDPPLTLPGYAVSPPTGSSSRRR